MPDRSPAGYDAHFADRRAIEEGADRARKGDAFIWSGPGTCRRAGHIAGCSGDPHQLRDGWISIDQGDGTVVEVEVSDAGV